MPRHTSGPKSVSKRMQFKGLGKLDLFCQTCRKQCRDENAFKQHSLSESHVRNMLVVGEDPRKHIHRYSEEFTHDFVELLRTSHREKSVPLNTFYQSYISDKQHIHMNATRFSSLREFAKYLGNTVVCRVTEDEGKGIYIAWVDNRADALRRRDANAKQERLRRSDEKHERETIQAQIARARQVANTVDQGSDDTLDGGEESPESKSFKGFVLAQRQPVTTSAIETPTSKPEAKNIFSTVKRQRQMEDISLARCLKKRRIR